MSNPENYQNDLVDPQTKELIRVDHRLLDQRLWLTQPELVCGLIKDIAEHGTGRGLPKVAESYLSATKGAFQLNTSPPKEPDYFLVLGNVLNADATPGPELTARLETALFMSKANPTAQLLVSGGLEVRDVKESAVMKRWLTNRGVGAERILVESKSMDTVENIKMSTAIMIQQNAKRICLITGMKGARRGACLLPSYLKHIGSSIRATYITPAMSEATDKSQDALALEQFLLFKDLGRVLDVWKYRGSVRQPDGSWGRLIQPWCGK